MGLKALSKNLAAGDALLSGERSCDRFEADDDEFSIPADRNRFDRNIAIHPPRIIPHSLVVCKAVCLHSAARETGSFLQLRMGRIDQPLAGLAVEAVGRDRLRIDLIADLPLPSHQGRTQLLKHFGVLRVVGHIVQGVRIGLCVVEFLDRPRRREASCLPGG